MRVTVLNHVGNFCEYWAAAFEDFQYDKTDPYCHIPMAPIEDWCEDVFGEQDIWGSDPVTGWKRMRNVFYFTQESARDMFVLRWA